jgi:hypothetical protein
VCAAVRPRACTTAHAIAERIALPAVRPHSRTTQL